MRTVGTSLKKYLHVCLASLGLLMMIPAAWHSFADPLRVEEARVAIKPLAAVSLPHFETEGSVDWSVVAPDTPVWQRIRSTWGEPGYVITAASPKTRNMYCFETLGLNVQAEIGSQTLDLAAANAPLYGYSAACRSYGLRFQMSPGAMAHIRIRTAANRRMPSGDLAVYWAGATEDRIVRSMLEVDLRKFLNLLALIGVGTLVGAAWIIFHRRLASYFSPHTRK